MSQAITVPFLCDSRISSRKFLFPIGRIPTYTIIFLSVFVVYSAVVEKFDKGFWYYFGEIFVSVVIFSIFSIIFELILRKFVYQKIIINDNNLFYVYPVGSGHKNKFIDLSVIEKIQFVRGALSYKDAIDHPYEGVGTFAKLLLIDKYSIEHELIPEFYIDLSRKNKEWAGFLAKLSSATGLKIEYLDMPKIL